MNQQTQFVFKAISKTLISMYEEQVLVKIFLSFHPSPTPEKVLETIKSLFTFFNTMPKEERTNTFCFNTSLGLLKRIDETFSDSAFSELRMIFETSNLEENNKKKLILEILLIQFSKEIPEVLPSDYKLSQLNYQGLCPFEGPLKTDLLELGYTYHFFKKAYEEIGSKMTDAMFWEEVRSPINLVVDFNEDHLPADSLKFILYSAFNRTHQVPEELWSPIKVSIILKHVLNTESDSLYIQKNNLLFFEKYSKNALKLNKEETVKVISHLFQLKNHYSTPSSTSNHYYLPSMFQRIKPYCEQETFSIAITGEISAVMAHLDPGSNYKLLELCKIRGTKFNTNEFEAFSRCPNRSLVGLSIELRLLSNFLIQFEVIEVTPESHLDLVKLHQKALNNDYGFLLSRKTVLSYFYHSEKDFSTEILLTLLDQNHSSRALQEVKSLDRSYLYATLFTRELTVAQDARFQEQLYGRYRSQDCCLIS